MPRYFTVEEANLALATLRPLVERMLELRQSILERQPEIWPALQKAVGNGGSQAASQVAMEFTSLDALARQIHASGALLKDLNQGLLDFPSLRDGREVYLCWRFNEESVQYWHDMDAGFAGRQRLTD
jgi:hypothetical protein